VSIRIEWDNAEQTILLHTYSGKWTLDDYAAAAHQAYSMVAAADHAVDFIIDLSQSDDPPMKITAAAIRMTELRHPLQRRVVMIGVTHFMMMLFEGGKRLMPHLTQEVYFAKTQDEARALLAGMAQAAEVA
jgi:hypothetical protein